jgi:5-methyltetrahydropteroyltriglutamate--homocysteine methyltransferase
MAATYRADHVGSLLRPPEVLQARTAVAEGRMTEGRLREVEDAAVLAALELQKQVGLDIYSDGEYRRGGWASDFQEAVNGYVPGDAPVRMQWRGAERPVAGTQAAAGRVIGEKLRQHRRLTGHESAFLKQHAPGPYKVTLPAASYMVARGYKPGVTDKAYGSRAEVLADAVAIIRAEIEALIGEGVPYIQIDNPHYPDYFDADKREQWRGQGIDPDKALREDIDADNQCVAGLHREGLTLATHICRGNGRSAWHTEGAYDPIAEQVFGGLNVDSFLLEYDTARSGGFEPLRYVPEGKAVVLGLVTTKDGALESDDEVMRRIENAAKYVPLENLALSPQCGFASVAEGNLLTWDDQRRKLELVVATARKVWG